jgi:hypothetical protein
MCAGLIVLSSLPITGCSNEGDEPVAHIRSFGKQHFPSENFFNQPNTITPVGLRWEAIKATGNYGFAIVATKNNTRSAKRILPKFCTRALNRIFREKLAKQVSRTLPVDVAQDVLINLTDGKFILTDLKRMPIKQEEDFFVTGCEAEVKAVEPEKSKLKLQYRLSKYLLKEAFYEDAAKVAKNLLNFKGFSDNAIAIIATSALNLKNEGALNYTEKFVDIGAINDPEILLLFSKAVSQEKMKNLAIRATNRCLQLKPDDKACLDFQLDILVDEKKYNQDEISDLESYL